MTVAPDITARLQAALAEDGAPSSDFDLNPDTVLPQGRRLRGAGVLVAVIGDHLILTKRSSGLKHHPGQIAFPGGKIDPGDDGPVGAALREAEEEIGLSRENVTVLGALPSHETVTGFTMTPVLAVVKAEFDPRPEPGEVAEVFRVPLAHVIDPGCFAIQSRRWRGTDRRYYTVPYGPYYIWGATARILRALAARMA
ncbi:CoA pyrophosphatase [Oceaniglobus ichthyenteri]|uniref:CoA pyrophosphatase n=1 Tax=Oceaniglobus ichthyenteri TaxID=2136177 RepID=UPI000D34FC74|nr:CoA pyrophosphatase [Oceaniglobus ichthyenteri]